MTTNGDAMTYYKATRLDGTDFYTGRIKYEVGRRVRPEPSASRHLCGPGYLHAADTPSEALVGGQWPCRLFEVSGKPRVGFCDEHPHKGGFAQLMVVREIGAWRAFGPNGRDVAALIDRARALTPNEIDGSDAAWAAAGAAAWAAWAAARDAARDAAREAAWAAAWEAAWAAAWAAARVAAWAAARAAAALVVRDLIPSEQFDLLYGPWRDVIG